MLSIPGICGLGLNFTVSGFRIVYCVLAAIAWIAAGLYSIEYLKNCTDKKRYHFFTILTFIATEGIFLSADFYTLFIFFEIMSLASYVWVAFDEKKSSLSAADTYMAVAVIGGLVMLMGLFLVYSVTGTLGFSELREAYFEYGLTAEEPQALKRLWAGGLCMLFGFFCKIGAVPLHIWLPNSYPAAPAPATALLSGILTKAGMFGVLLLCFSIFADYEVFGVLILVSGVITMFIGAFLALFSVNLKRTLACSSISQIGFILVGTGMAVIMSAEKGMALRGALSHMLNHTFAKLCLFMAAGVVFTNVNKLNLNDVRGFGKNKPVLKFVFLTGGLSLAGFPLFSGYVSKTLMHEAIVEYTELLSKVKMAAIMSVPAMKAVEWIFLISGGMTLAYMTKLFVCIFVESNESDEVQAHYDSLKGKYMGKLTGAVLTVCAAVLPVFGILPNMTLLKITEISADIAEATVPGRIALFSFANLKGAFISLLIGAVIYIVVVRGFIMSKYEVNEFGFEDLNDVLSGKLKEDAEGRRYKLYVKRWNKYVNLEEYVYKPVIFKFLPFVFGIACRFLDSIVDWLVVFLRKSIYKDSKIPQELEEGNIFTYIIGSILNKLQDIRNLTIAGKRGIAPKFEDYEHKAAMTYERIDESVKIITRSMSFGLIIFCIGLLLTVAYIVVLR